MTVEQAITLAEKLRFAPLVIRDKDAQREYVGYSCVEEICADKLQWAIVNAVGLSGKKPPVYNINTGWESTDYPNLYANNLFDFEETSWGFSCTNHYDGDVASFDKFICENTEPIRYSFFLLAFTAACMISYDLMSLDKFRAAEITLFADMQKDLGVDMDEFLDSTCYGGYSDDMTLTEEELATDIYNLMYQLVHLFETGSYASEDAFLKVLGTEASDYLEECIDILIDTFWCGLKHDAVGQFLPFFMLFVYVPGWLACTEYGAVPQHFWVYSKEGVASYKNWRQSYQVAAEPLILALDRALYLVQLPMIQSDYLANGYFYTKDTLVSWMATLSDDYSQFEPFYIVARQIIDTLLPVWEEKYGQLAE